MEGSNNSLTIREFAFKKQAPVDGLVNAVLNGVITYFLLSGLADIPVISHPGSVFSKSLLGTLVMPAIVIAFVISLLTSRTAVKKRIKGEITPPLDAGVPWVKHALKWGIARAVLNVFIVYGLGGMLIQISPDMRVSRLAAAIIVFVMAFVLAYIESVAAVLRTPNARVPA
jgi:hypothetical protein